VITTFVFSDAFMLMILSVDLLLISFCFALNWNNLIAFSSFTFWSTV